MPQTDNIEKHKVIYFTLVEGKSINVYESLFPVSYSELKVKETLSSAKYASPAEKFYCILDFTTFN